MRITKVQLTLCDSNPIKAYGYVVFDDSFVVHDIRIVSANSGLTVAMPSRKSTYNCPGCRMRVAMDASFCHRCGSELAETTTERKIHFDIVHPINAEFRKELEKHIFAEFGKIGGKA